MELQIPHSVCAEISQARNIWKDKDRYWAILRKLCDVKKVEIIEANACSDHIHMLAKIPPNISVAQFMGYLKGKSTLMIFDRHVNLKYKYGNRHFWCGAITWIGRTERS